MSKKEKSQWISAGLTMVLGPIGLLYTNPAAALGMSAIAVTALFMMQIGVVLAVWGAAIGVGALTIHIQHRALARAKKARTSQSETATQALEVPRHPVGQIVQIEDQQLAIIDMGAEASRTLKVEMDRNILTHGEPFSSGGILGERCLPLIGAGATVTASLAAGNLFVATANPATLMTIGSGVGSAVMGPTGIIKQMPFISAGSAIIPVVAPVMFFMTVSSMMMSARLEQVQMSLDKLASAVEQLLAREVAGDYGTLLSAMERLRDVDGEFNESRRFTEEMKIRIALIERDLNVLHHKYDILSTNKVHDMISASLAVEDANLFTMASLADIHTDRLRLKLALQDNPDDFARSFGRLNEKISRYETHFRDLLENDAVEAYEEELGRAVRSMGWWKRNVFSRAEHHNKRRDMDAIGELRTGRHDSVRVNIRQWADDMVAGSDTGIEQAVVYYREDGGAGDLKAYYSNDWKIVNERDACGARDVATEGR